ncbi:MAG: hypothetical protein C0613_06635 [Desulfobulbaceae bacterium]|nr:MAG: hypothetical protein C0613_06635 [Desulfobulbaceae bacterium]
MTATFARFFSSCPVAILLLQQGLFFTVGVVLASPKNRPHHCTERTIRAQKKTPFQTDNKHMMFHNISMKNLLDPPATGKACVNFFSDSHHA